MQRTLRAVLAAYPALSDGNGWLKAQIYAELRRELAILARLEEEILYPAIEALDAEGVARAREDHATIGRLVAEMDALVPGEGAFDFRIHLLADAVERLALLEAEAIFPRLEEIDVPRQDAVWESFRTLKQELRSLPAKAS